MQTPLKSVHEELGASWTSFHGNLMPLDYGSPVSEALAVRKSSGVFDVSHLGRVLVEGPGTEDLLELLLTRSFKQVGSGYCIAPCLMLNEEAGILDDLVVAKLSSSKALLVVNAASRLRVLEWITAWSEKLEAQVKVVDATRSTAMIALQGPRSLNVAREAGLPVPSARREFLTAKWRGEEILVSRTGWTGEDGLEIIGAPSVLEELFAKLVKLGATPCGLAARDMLRMEKGYPLMGADITLDKNPVEARYWAFDDHGSYVGYGALRRALQRGALRVRMGFLCRPRGAFPRSGWKVVVNGVAIGEVTSSAFSPLLRRPLAQGYIFTRYALPGLKVELVDPETSRRSEARISSMPFT